MRLLLDMNSILNAALLGGKDEDDGRTVIDENGRKHQVNSAQYGVDKFFATIDQLCIEFEIAPRQMIVVPDGKNAKLRRQAFLPTYKEGRNKIPEVSEQLNLARDICTQGMLDLGAHVAQQQGFEADDVIGYLCKTLRNEPNVVITSDGDLTVLVDENTHVWRLGKMNENPYGPFPHKYITLYKALVGDTSDKIPGAKGFGDVAWCDLVRTFGVEGLEEFQRMIVEGCLHEIKDNVADLPVLQKVLDNKDMVTTSWRVASLFIDEINTMDRPLEVRAGMVKQWGAEGFQAPELRRFYGTKTLVTAKNYAGVRERFAHVVGTSPFVSLDIETSSSEESDEWLESVKKAPDSDRIDVLGHELTGMSLTFGDNTQHTVYMSVDHADTDNITVDQCREMCELIPSDKMHTVIQNRQFEFSVLYRTWGEKWKDNGWYGMVPNAIDTKVGASYTDENLKKGLKERSLHHLGYKQATYEETTQKSGPVGTLTGGRVIKAFNQELVPASEEQVPQESIDADTGEITVEYVLHKIPAVIESWETREYKMRELPAYDVFDYGADDTICTSALHTHYKFVMDLENTWNVYLEVETLPEYLTSLAFVQGIKISPATLRDMEKRDDATYDAAWKTLREYLMTKGWEGTACPEFEGSIEPSDAKLAVSILLGDEFTTRKRKLDGIAFDIREQFPDNGITDLLAEIIAKNDVNALNSLIKQHFTGEPKINFGSPKQMQQLFYTTLGIKPRIVNKLTDMQRNDDVMVSAFKKMRLAKKSGVDLFSNPIIEVLGNEVAADTHEVSLALTKDEYRALISKSSTDDTAVDTALALDDLTDEVKKVLKAYKDIKEVQTRRNLFYKTYKAIPHWRDGRIHPSLNQAQAVTRRYSASSPNVQQLPSKGDGAKFREVLLPHHRDAVVASIDWSGQELRLGAELSGDEAMTSCYVGDNLRDMHSLAAIAAAPYMWGQAVSYAEFQAMRKSADPVIAAKAKKLRDDAKTVGFASQYGAMAPKIAETMMCEESIAQTFLDARDEAFPGIGVWSKRVQAQAYELGYAQTMMGARRHLAKALSNENKWERASAERQVGNFWIQSSGAEMAKLAMARVWQSGIVTGKYDAVFLCPIHDELVFSVHKDQAAEFIAEAHACMVAQYSTMKIPLESSIAIGKTFACEVDIGTVPDAEVIKKAVAKLFQ